MEFNISFIVDGEVYSTIDTNGAETIKMPDDPVKEGYEFDGWFWDKDKWEKAFTPNSLLDTPLSSNMSVYAKWKNGQETGDECELKAAEGFTIDGNTAFCKVPNSTGTFNFINKITVSDNAAWGIYNEISATNEIQSKTISLDIGDNIVYLLIKNGKNISLYTLTVRRRPVYTVSFNMNGGTAVESKSIEEDGFLQPDIMPQDLTRNGYTFSDWNFDFNIPVTDNTVVTPTWRAVEYTISYTNTLDGNNSNTITAYTIESETIIFENPTRIGYTGSWDIESILTGSTGNKVISAVWQPTEYKITYVNLVDGTHNNPSTYTIESEIIIFENPTRPGYTGSWDIESIPAGSTGDREITAVWAGNSKYNVIFNPDGGNIGQTQKEVIFGSEYTFEAPTHEYYTFGGWYTEIGGGGSLCQNGSIWNIPEDITLYAYWLGTPNLQYTLDGNSYFVSKGTADTDSAVYIQNYYNGKPVTYIYTNAFFNCGSLESIVIPESVTVIGDLAFSNCSSLTSIVIGDSVTYIGDLAFSNCSSLTSIVIGDSVTYIGDLAFSNCSSLESIVIPESVTVIGDSAFNFCYSLTSIVIPENVTVIRDNAFNYCISLTSIVIPENVTVIGDSAFSNCRNLTSIVIGGSVTYIGSDAFYRCNSLIIYAGATSKPSGWDSNWNNSSRPVYWGLNDTNLIESEGLQYVILQGKATVIGIKTLETSITIPSYIEISGTAYNVTGIGNSAFGNCSRLTNIVIPNNVTSIGSSAFSNCSKLTSIIIPASVTSIGSSAFSNCSSLTIYAEATSKPSGWDSNWNYSSRPVYWGINDTNLIESDGLQYVILQGKATVTRITTLETSITIPSSIEISGTAYNVTVIGSYAFSGCTSLTSIIIPDTVMSIGSYAFSYCSNLTSIIIPASVTSIGNSAFSGCTSLTSIVIPESVTSIGNSAFSGCTSLTSIIIPETVTGIGDLAFSECSSLTIYAEATGKPSGWSSYWNNDIPPVYWGINDTNFTEAGGLQYVILQGKATVTRITSVEASITIPSSVEISGTAYNVTGIGSFAFRGCTNLTSIIIGGSVTSIGNFAFSECSSLKSIVIPNSVTSIGNFAFYVCGNLTSIVIPDSVTSIGNYVFSNCSSLPSVIIPDSVTSIGNSAFSNCSSLTSVIIPDSVTSIGNYVFSNCSSLTSVIIPDSVTSIGNSAFSNCSSLTSVIIPDSVTSIGNSAFIDCSSLTIYAEATSKPSGWDSNWNNSSCPVYWDTNLIESEGLQYVILQGKATVIGITTLEKSIIIPSSIEISGITYNVTGIGSYAFYGCTSLTSIVIPNSVTSIGSYAFSGCTSLTSIIIPNTVMSIGSSAFSNCSRLTRIVIPNSVTIIGSYAFYGCKSLTDIIIPNSVTSIGDYAFGVCSSLTSIVIPDSVTSIGDYAFGVCSSLTSIVIPDSVTSIGDSAFYRCSSLTSIVIPESVTSIGNYTFYVCSNLTSIVIPDSVTSIGNFAFSYCTSLTSIVIPDSVTSIGNSAFIRCSSLKSIVIGNSVTNIGNSAFSGCISLTGIVIPNSVTGIGNSAFSGCSSLASIVIPNSVTDIGNYAFEFCSSLTNIIIPDNVTIIGRLAFSGCNSLAIYAEATSKPSGWDIYWNYSDRPVVWGYTGN